MLTISNVSFFVYIIIAGRLKDTIQLNTKTVLSNYKILVNLDSPKISPTPIKIPERPIRLFSSLPNLFIAPIHVPYTPEKNVNSKPLKEIKQN